MQQTQQSLTCKALQQIRSQEEGQRTQNHITEKQTPMEKEHGEKFKFRIETTPLGAKEKCQLVKHGRMKTRAWMPRPHVDARHGSARLYRQQWGVGEDRRICGVCWPVRPAEAVDSQRREGPCLKNQREV